MAVKVITAADSSRRGEDVYPGGRSIFAFEGHLAVTTGENGVEDGVTIALYAPGTWFSAYLDDSRSPASPPRLGLRT